MSSPSLDLDWRLRHAALDALRRITDRSGGVVTREQMTQGFEFEGERVPFALRARGIWKPARLGPGGAALSIRTATVRELGTHPISVPVSASLKPGKQVLDWHASRVFLG